MEAVKEDLLRVGVTEVVRNRVRWMDAVWCTVTSKGSRQKKKILVIMEIWSF